MNTLKQQYIERAETHAKADDFRQGFYWEDGKGCCIGCLAHSNYNAHEDLQEQTNIPVWLARVADTLFEGLTVKESKGWPVRFIKAVPEQVFSKEWGATEIDKRIKAPFLIMVLESTLETFDHEEFPKVKDAVEGSIALWKRDDIGTEEWNEAAEAAAEAAWAARAAAEAAEAAEAARAAAGAAEAAEAAEAARAARAAAEAAEAAEAAAWAAAEAAEAAEAAAWAAGAAKYLYFTNRLVEIMETAGAR